MQKENNFTFEPENHIYKLNGVVIPSVTNCLPYNFFGNDTEYSRERGQLVHSCIELYNMNNLDEESLDPVLVPYLDGYKKFIAENGTPKGLWDIKSGSPQPAEELQLAGYALLVREGLTADGKKAEQTFEVPLYHQIYRFSGTPDIVNVEYSGIERDVIMPFAMHCLYLSAEGKYKMSKDYSKDYRRNREIFLSFLTVFKWRAEHGYANRAND